MADKLDAMMEKLIRQRGFTLQKISPTTLPGDVVSRHKRKEADGVPESEFPGILGLCKSGSCFRCRIGKGRFWYAETAAEAIKKALGGEP
mgnify:CR=1 FL=1